MTEPLNINDLRRRILAGEQPTEDELRAAIAALRGNRQVAVTTSRAAKEPIDLNSLFAPKPAAEA